MEVKERKLVACLRVNKKVLASRHFFGLSFFFPKSFQLLKFSSLPPKVVLLKLELPNKVLIPIERQFCVLSSIRISVLGN